MVCECDLAALREERLEDNAGVIHDPLSLQQPMRHPDVSLGRNVLLPTSQPYRLILDGVGLIQHLPNRVGKLRGRHSVQDDLADGDEAPVLPVRPALPGDDLGQKEKVLIPNFAAQSVLGGDAGILIPFCGCLDHDFHPICLY